MKNGLTAGERLETRPFGLRVPTEKRRGSATKPAKLKKKEAWKNEGACLLHAVEEIQAERTKSEGERGLRGLEEKTKPIFRCQRQCMRVQKSISCRHIPPPASSEGGGSDLS